MSRFPLLWGGFIRHRGVKASRGARSRQSCQGTCFRVSSPLYRQLLRTGVVRFYCQAADIGSACLRLFCDGSILFLIPAHRLND